MKIFDSIAVCIVLVAGVLASCSTVQQPCCAPGNPFTYGLWD